MASVACSRDKTLGLSFPADHSPHVGCRITLTAICFKYCFDILWFLDVGFLASRVRDLSLTLFSQCAAYVSSPSMIDEKYSLMSLYVLRASKGKCSKVNC